MQPIINTMLDPIVNFGKVTVLTKYDNTATEIVLTTGHDSNLPNLILKRYYKFNY